MAIQFNSSSFLSPRRDQLEAPNLIFLSFYETVHFLHEYLLNRVCLNRIHAIKYMKVVTFPDLTVRDISVNNYNNSFSFMSELYWGFQTEWKIFACSNFQKGCRNLKFNQVFVIIFRNVSSFNKNIMQPQLLWLGCWLTKTINIWTNAKPHTSGQTKHYLSQCTNINLMLKTGLQRFY